MNVLEAALFYAREGKYVFPLSPNSKLPIKGTRGYLDASVNEQQIRDWFEAHPDRNLGIALAPSKIFALDFDWKHGAAETLAATEHLLSGALVAQTPGGKHFYFDTPDGFEPIRITSDQRGHATYKGVDFLSDGYLVAPPSIVDGKEYGFIAEGDDRTPPKFALETIAEWRAGKRKAKERKQPITSASELARIGEGGRNRALFELGCTLRSSGLEEDAIAAALLTTNESRCDPPLPDYEVAAVATQAAKYEPDADILGASILRAAAEKRAQAAKPKGSGLGLLSELVTGDEPPEQKVPTGFPDVDTLTRGGLASGALSVILAPPAAGKTTMALNLALRWCKEAPVLLVNAEIQPSEIAARIVGIENDLVWADLLNGKGDVEERKRLYQTTLPGKAIYVLSEADLPHDTDRKMLTLAERVNEIEEATEKTPYVIVDYLQKLAPPGKDRGSGVTAVCGTLATFAREARTVFVAISSVSRSHYGNGKQEPNEDPTSYLSAAKESGDVEYDAHTVLYVDLSATKNEQGLSPTRIAVAKCRSGQNGFGYLLTNLATGKQASCEPPRTQTQPTNKGGRNLQTEPQEDKSKAILKAIAELEIAGHHHFTASQIAQHVGRTLSVSDLTPLEARGFLTKQATHPITRLAPPRGALYWYSRKKE